MSEMNVGAELNKLQRISEQAAVAVNLHLDNPDFDVVAVIKQIKQEILELLAPIDIQVVYREPNIYQGGIKREALSFHASNESGLVSVKDVIGLDEYDERKGDEVYLETETLE